jgi:hypothetical protein
MRFLLTVMLLSAALAAEAQSQARPLPPGSRPLEEPPPIPAAEQDVAGLQPQVTTRREEDKEIAEYRMNGKLYMVRVTPKNGKPYTLTDPKGRWHLHSPRQHPLAEPGRSAVGVGRILTPPLPPSNVGLHAGHGRRGVRVPLALFAR